MGGEMIARHAVSGSIEIPGSVFGPVPPELVERWRVAYTRYGQLASPSTAAPGAYAEAARVSARASQELADLWAEIAACPGHPWWLQAALGSTAQAFGDQAVRWERQAAESEAARRPRRVRGAGGAR